MGVLDLLDLTTLVIFMTTFCLIYYVLSGPRNLPPGPCAWPVFGNMFDIAAHAENLPDAFARYARKYGNIFRLKFGNLVIIVLNDYNIIHQALVKKSDMFSDRPDFLWIFKQIGPGFILSNGQTWKDLRRLALHSMRDFGMGKATIEDKVLEEVSLILKFLSENEAHPLKIDTRLSMATSNIICSIIFGSRFDYDDEKFKKMLRALDVISRRSSFFVPENGIPFLRYLPGANKGGTENIRAFEEIGDIISNIVEDHASSYDKEHIRDFVDLFIKLKTEEGQATYNEHQFLELLVDLFIAGTETTSTTLQWALLYMMAYPDIQAKCQEEIDQIVGQGRMVNQADRLHLPYVDATSLEIQRLSSIVPLSIPHATLQDTTLCGYNIPAKSIIIPNLMAVHMDPNLWSEPEMFKPERFLNESGRVLKKDAFVTFSLGPRTCAGEPLARTELFLYFSNLLQCFKFRKPEGSTLSFKAHISVQRSPFPFKVVAFKR